MSHHLIIIAGESYSDPVNWRLMDEKGAIIGRGLCSAEDVVAHRAEYHTLVLNGAQCVTRMARIAARNQAQLRQAAPFAVEDDVAESIEDLHVALGADQGEGMRAAVVVERDYLADWVEAFEQFKFKLDCVVPDYLCIPGDDQKLTILRSVDAILLRLGAWGARVDAALGEDALQAICRIALEQAGVAERQEFNHYGEELYDLIATNVAAAPVNLLQGEFATRSGSVADLSGLKTIGALAAMFFAGVAGMAYYEATMLRQQSRQVEQRTEQIVKQTFPEISRVVNPRAQVRQRVSTSGQSGDAFLSLSSLLALGLKSSSNVDLESLRFDGDRGALTASIVFTDYSDIATFKDAITEAGGNLEEGGSREFNGRRLGDVTVTQ